MISMRGCHGLFRMYGRTTGVNRPLMRRASSSADKQVEVPFTYEDEIANIDPEETAGPKTLLRVRRNDILTMVKAARFRMLNWTMDYFLKYQDERSREIIDIVKRSRPDVAVLHDVSPVKDEKAKKSVYEWLLEELVDTGEYSMFLYEECMKKHPYGFVVKLLRKDSLDVKSSDVINLSKGDHNCFHLRSDVEIRTNEVNVPICVLATQVGKTHQRSYFFEHGCQLLAECPTPSAYALYGYPGKVDTVRRPQEERRSMSRKLSDTLVKSGQAEKFRFNYDGALNTNIFEHSTKRYNLKYSKRARPLRTFVGPGVHGEPYRPLVHKFFHVGLKPIGSVNIHPSRLFGVFTELLVPVECSSAARDS
mmetsp:Transcript_4137/g.12439  ORF Transcript_4137/g.12439 Transcript_4137/m.12439 type:complete len:364 (+) Transcript_4137:159-1250(+)